MRLRLLRLSNFRNVSFAEIPLDHERVFLLGANGQGKTNLIEAIGLLPALRSFRTQNISLLLRHGSPCAQAGFALTHEIEGEVNVAITLSAHKKNVLVDGSPARQFSEFLGRFPVVSFCSSDIELLRSSPATRRRWLDMALAAEDPAYLIALRSYHTALSNRNQLLRLPSPDPAQLSAFEKTMAPCAASLLESRRLALLDLSARLTQHCTEIGLPPTAASLAYIPNASPPNSEKWQELFYRQRQTDALLRSTQRGPHRDDFKFLFHDHLASAIASEGQQRALVLALELAWLSRQLQNKPVSPIVLADDILGELDPPKKNAFWHTLGNACQVIATGTTPPPPSNTTPWHIIHVNQGTYSP
ncbi:MAG: DNA replication and repair protein RecF [Puniceicoccales bacterium]|jgi:DNA replication and repair protein RecF|nr:DNA replication and repair protein RecF [Puniceicoccales bacterium]